jgi:hypothetical protein
VFSKLKETTEIMGITIGEIQQDMELLRVAIKASEIMQEQLQGKIDKLKEQQASQPTLARQQEIEVLEKCGENFSREIKEAQIQIRACEQ